jgi:multidrug resistance efflux pump
LESAKARLTKLELQPRPEELPPSLAKVKAATANTARLKDQFDRAERLVRSGAVTEAELVMKRLSFEAASQEEAQAQADHDLLKAGAWKPDIAIAKAEIAQASASIEQLKTEISRATVVSPIDGEVLQVHIRAGERVSDQDDKALMILGGLDAYHVRVDIDERDIARFQRGAAAKAYPRGETAHEIGLRFSRVEPLVVPKTSLTGENTERVDTRVLQVIYAIDSASHDVYVGQQLDVFVNGDQLSPNDGLVAEK